MDASNAETQQPLPLTDVFSIPVTPALINDMETTTKIFRTIGEKQKALVLTGYATGSTPEKLNPLIAELTQKGVPVFVLSNNPGENTGIRRVKYEEQQKAVDAGAIPLRDPNRNNAYEVLVQIQTFINEGKTGTELTNAVVEKFGTAQRYTPNLRT